MQKNNSQTHHYGLNVFLRLQELDTRKKWIKPSSPYQVWGHFWNSQLQFPKWGIAILVRNSVDWVQERRERERENPLWVWGGERIDRVMSGEQNRRWWDKKRKEESTWGYDLLFKEGDDFWGRKIVAITCLTKMPQPSTTISWFWNPHMATV